MDRDHHKSKKNNMNERLPPIVQPLVKTSPVLASIIRATVWGITGGVGIKPAPVWSGNIRAPDVELAGAALVVTKAVRLTIFGSAATMAACCTCPAVFAAVKTLAILL